MKINNIELELDIYDADIMEKVENAITNVVENVNKECKTNSESIRLQCSAIMDCFNTIFGEGIDKQIFGGKTNLMKCVEAFEILANEINNQKAKLAKINNKYNLNKIKR